MVRSLLAENPWGGWDFAHWDGGHMQGLVATNFLWSGGLLSRKKTENEAEICDIFSLFRLDVLKAY